MEFESIGLIAVYGEVDVRENAEDPPDKVEKLVYINPAAVSWIAPYKGNHKCLVHVGGWNLVVNHPIEQVAKELKVKFLAKDDY